jgi:hypothetical protein
MYGSAGAPDWHHGPLTTDHCNLHSEGVDTVQRILFIGLVLFAFGILAWMQGAGSAQGSDRGLQDSRPAIDAGRYETLQAALDALPKEDGLVRLPPGTFLITEPLRIENEDVCIEGAGTATHIKNLNQEGRPAILVAHPGDAKIPRRIGSTIAGGSAWRIFASPGTRRVARASRLARSMRSSSTA